jgi:hypothetical protein
LPEGRNAGPWEDLEDPRMWRLLLARLHPDAGGDQELFAFACAAKEELCRGRPAVRRPAGARGEHRARQWERRAADTFLEEWQRAMFHWSSHNRDTLRNVRSR